MRTPAALLVLPALVLALAGCASTTSATTTPTAAATTTATASADDCADGVGVVVEFGDFETDAEPVSTCVPADGAITAADALEQAGVTTEGTKQYGDQVVCRVNGQPAETASIPNPDGTEYHETCATMPAAFAYWSIWVKPADGDWAYANEGLATQQVEPGQRLGLLFQLDGQPAAP